MENEQKQQWLFRDLFIDKIKEWPEKMRIDELLEYCHRLVSSEPRFWIGAKCFKAHLVRNGVVTYSRKTKYYTVRYDYPDYQNYDLHKSERPGGFAAR